MFDLSFLRWDVNILIPQCPGNVSLMCQPGYTHIYLYIYVYVYIYMYMCIYIYIFFFLYSTRSCFGEVILLSCPGHVLGHVPGASHSSLCMSQCCPSHLFVMSRSCALLGGATSMLQRPCLGKPDNWCH